VRQLHGRNIRFATIIRSPHTACTYSPWKHAHARCTSPCSSPSTYVDLSLAVRGQLASGTYVNVLENLIVALRVRVIVAMLPQDTLRQLSGVDCTPTPSGPSTTHPILFLRSLLLALCYAGWDGVCCCRAASVQDTQ